MSFVQFLTNKAQESAVTIPKDFSFGFEPYVKKDLIPEKEHIQPLYKQSKIIAQLMMLLYESNDYGIDFKNIMRESVDASILGGKNKDNVGTLDGNRSIFLRRKDLRSYIFSLDFSTYTSVLRNFINKLQDYNLPVIIRSLEIRHSKSGSSGSGITVTEKMQIALVLEWIFVENGKNLLKSESIRKE
jgi:hypothetical protein